jgi:hypothetical protein
MNRVQITSARLLKRSLYSSRSVQASAANAREQLGDVERQISNLVRLAAAGAGDVAGLARTIQELEERRRARATLTARTPRQRSGSRRALETQLRSPLDQWRELLREDVAGARPVLDSLLTGRIVITPHLDAPRQSSTCVSR